MVWLFPPKTIQPSTDIDHFAQQMYISKYSDSTAVLVIVALHTHVSQTASLLFYIVTGLLKDAFHSVNSLAIRYLHLGMGGTLASFPGHSQLQFSITCSMVAKACD